MTENGVDQLDHVAILWQPFVSGNISSKMALSVSEEMTQLQVRDVCFVHLLLQYFRHVVLNWIQIW